MDNLDENKGSGFFVEWSVSGLSALSPESGQ